MLLSLIDQLKHLRGQYSTEGSLLASGPSCPGLELWFQKKKVIDDVKLIVHSALLRVTVDSLIAD